MTTTPILNFSKGELGPQLYGRIDASQYGASAKRMRNVIAQRYGGAAARPGFRLIGRLDDQDQPVKLVPFQFSIDQAYVIGMQQAKARLLAFGGFVLEQNTQVTLATQTSPMVVTAPFHGYEVGDRAYFSGVQGMVELNGRAGTVLSVNGTDEFTVDIDARGFSRFSSSDGTLNAAPPAPPVPTPTPAPTPPPAPPPSTGGGGGSGGGSGGRCVRADTMILTSVGEVRGEWLSVGDYVRTKHEATKEWGDFPITAITSEIQPVLALAVNSRMLYATPDHRIYVDGEWRTMAEMGGTDAGSAMILQITVADAHTYVSNGVLSHNLKQIQQNEA